MIDRKRVYDCIDTERTYQEDTHKAPRTNTEYLVIIEHYVREAFRSVSTRNDDQGTVAPLRKIAALAVAAMEQNGFEDRRIPHRGLDYGNIRSPF